jgi:hypothetical protein
MVMSGTELTEKVDRSSEPSNKTWAPYGYYAEIEVASLRSSSRSFNLRHTHTTVPISVSSRSPSPKKKGPGEGRHVDNLHNDEHSCENTRKPNPCQDRQFSERPDTRNNSRTQGCDKCPYNSAQFAVSKDLEALRQADEA